MQQENEQLDRRGFLRLTGAGAAVLGTKALFPSLLFAQEKPVELTDRAAPKTPSACALRRWKLCWTGAKSYILGLAKYMEGPGVERVRYTCERYKLQKTTQVDVLSYYAIRNDWDRKRPASGIRNLTAGRYRVLEEFAKRDVDVTSEALRYPMIGHISNFWYGQFSSACPFGGSIIPLLPVIYRKSAVWGYSGGSRSDHAFDRINQFFTEGVRIAFSVEIWIARRSRIAGIWICCRGSICTR